jgi:hypothetical protein
MENFYFCTFTFLEEKVKEQKQKQTEKAEEKKKADTPKTVKNLVNR